MGRCSYRSYRVVVRKRGSGAGGETGRRSRRSRSRPPRACQAPGRAALRRHRRRRSTGRGSRKFGCPRGAAVPARCARPGRRARSRVRVGARPTPRPRTPAGGANRQGRSTRHRGLATASRPTSAPAQLTWSAPRRRRTALAPLYFTTGTAGTGAARRSERWLGALGNVDDGPSVQQRDQDLRQRCLLVHRR